MAPPTRSQPRRRPLGVEEPEAEPGRRAQADAEEEAADDESGDALDGPDASAPSSLHRELAKKLVRYALSSEYSRTPIRRDGIKERVLGNHGRLFKRVFVLAQQQLRTVFGMELRELPVREKMTLQEKRQAMRSQSRLKSGSGAYILTSSLPGPYRSASILTPSKVPSADEEATYVAFYTLVISLIWLSGGEMSEQKLQRHLLRLNASRNLASEKTETVLRKMERQGYVMRQADRAPLGQDGDPSVTWHLGPRAKEEIGLDGVMGLVREVYGGSSPELEKKMRLSLGLKSETTAAAGAGNEENEGEGDAAEGGERSGHGAGGDQL